MFKIQNRVYGGVQLKRALGGRGVAEATNTPTDKMY